MQERIKVDNVHGLVILMSQTKIQEIRNATTHHGKAKNLTRMYKQERQKTENIYDMYSDQFSACACTVRAELSCSSRKRWSWKGTTPVTFWSDASTHRATTQSQQRLCRKRRLSLIYMTYIPSLCKKVGSCYLYVEYLWLKYIQALIHCEQLDMCTAVDLMENFEQKETSSPVYLCVLIFLC